MEQLQQPAYVTIVPPAAAEGYQAQPIDTQPQPRYKQGAARTTGYIQIFCGVASMAFGVVVHLVLFGVIREHSMHLGHLIFGIVSWPIWSGLVYLITGSLGASAKVGDRCLITGYVVMSIIAAIFAFGQMIWEILAVFVTKCYDFNSYDDDYNSHDYYNSDPYAYYSRSCGTQISNGMHIGAVIVAVVEIIAAITGSALGCQPLCSAHTETHAVHVQYHHHPTQNIVHPGAPVPLSTDLYPKLPQYSTHDGTIPNPPGYISTNNSAFVPEYTSGPSAPDQPYLESGIPVE